MLTQISMAREVQAAGIASIKYPKIVVEKNTNKLFSGGGDLPGRGGGLGGGCWKGPPMLAS